MNRKLNCILLIDDDESTNFINEIVLKKAGCTDKIVVKQSARQALEYLSVESDHENPKPDLIFLDINMPAINGWEFIEKYRDISDAQKAKIVMLSNSFNPDDAHKAKRIREIKGYKNKPLTIESVKELIQTHFSE